MMIAELHLIATIGTAERVAVVPVEDAARLTAAIRTTAAAAIERRDDPSSTAESLELSSGRAFAYAP